MKSAPGQACALQLRFGSSRYTTNRNPKAPRDRGGQGDAGGERPSSREEPQGAMSSRWWGRDEQRAEEHDSDSPRRARLQHFWRKKGRFRHLVDDVQGATRSPTSSPSEPQTRPTGRRRARACRALRRTRARGRSGRRGWPGRMPPARGSATSRPAGLGDADERQHAGTGTGTARAARSRPASRRGAGSGRRGSWRATGCGRTRPPSAAPAGTEPRRVRVAMGGARLSGSC